MRVIVWTVALASCGGETGIQNLYPSLAVAPDGLHFGEVGPPLSSTLPLYVSNAGGGDLAITSLTLDAPAVFTLTPPEGATAGTGDREWSFFVDPDGQVLLPVTFTPDSYRSWTGQIVLETNDDEHPRVVVPLSGEGVDLPFGDLAIAPAQTIEAVDVPAGTSVLMSFDLLNTGDAPLTVSAISLVGDGSFSEESVPTGAVIQPGDQRTAIYRYAPTSVFGNFALVSIESDDPDESPMPVLLLGNGGGKDFDYPVAVIDCPPTVLLAGPEYVHLDGAGSYDPEKHPPLTYEWSVTERPAASDADVVLDPDDTAAIDLYADVAGDWTVQLVVRNALGTESEPATCSFSAIPEDAIHVELSWDTPQADLDLHLVQGGSDLFDVPQDCTWCNQSPQWGAVGPDDDPRLDIDDRGGFGPENINLLAPEDGTYEVLVNYFAPHGDGDVVATVRVWLLGALVFDGSRVVEVGDAVWDVWDVGTIDMPTGAFYVDPSPNVTTALRQCQN